MKNVVLGAALGSVLLGVTQTTNPAMAAEFDQFGLTPIAGNPLPSIAWYGIGAACFVLYLSMSGGRA